MGADNHLAGRWPIVALAKEMTLGRADYDVQDRFKDHLYSVALRGLFAQKGALEAAQFREALSTLMGDYAAGRYDWRSALWASAINDRPGQVYLLHLLLLVHHPMKPGETENDRLAQADAILTDLLTSMGNQAVFDLFKDILDCAPKFDSPTSDGESLSRAQITALLLRKPYGRSLPEIRAADEWMLVNVYCRPSTLDAAEDGVYWPVPDSRPDDDGSEEGPAAASFWCLCLAIWERRGLDGEALEKKKEEYLLKNPGADCW